MKKLALATSLLALSSTGVMAQESAAKFTGTWGFGGHAALISINSDTAKQQGIDKSAYLIGMTGDYSQNNWVTSLGVDIIVYDDNNQFKQVVEGQGSFNRGDVSTEKSSANGVLLSVATGYQWLVGEEQNVALRLQGGASAMVNSERSIESCSNCYSQDIDVDGGLFVKASALRNTDSLSFGVFLQQYLGDGLSTAFGVTLASRF